MERFQDILAALDLGPDGEALTPGSRKAMQRAVWIANQVDGSVKLLHSNKTDERWDSKSRAYVEDPRHQIDPQGVVDAALVELNGTGVGGALIVSAESAPMAIIRQVLRDGTDVVVAGKHSHADGDDPRPGTVARKLLRKCPCAVWLEDPRQSSDPSVILAATDLTPVGDRVTQLVASVAHSFGAVLHIVHAFSLSMEVQFEGDTAKDAYIRSQRDAAIEHIDRSLASTPLAGVAKLHVGCTSPTQAILEGVERLKPGLVVMGTVSRGGVAGLLMGNTAERLVDRIDCALLTVKPEDFVCPVSLDPSPG
jgi:universal stress protein E